MCGDWWCFVCWHFSKQNRRSHHTMSCSVLLNLSVCFVGILVSRTDVVIILCPVLFYSICTFVLFVWITDPLILLAFFHLVLS